MNSSFFIFKCINLAKTEKILTTKFDAQKWPMVHINVRVHTKIIISSRGYSVYCNDNISTITKKKSNVISEVIADFKHFG